MVEHPVGSIVTLSQIYSHLAETLRIHPKHEHEVSDSRTSQKGPSTHTMETLIDTETGTIVGPLYSSYVTQVFEVPGIPKRMPLANINN